jgi:hypothetical protein
MSLAIGVGLMLSVLVFRLLPDIPFAALPALVLFGLGLYKIFENSQGKRNLIPKVIRVIDVPAWRIGMFLLIGILLPSLAFFFTNIGPSIWMPALLIAQQFLVPGQWTRFLLGAALFALIWVCLLLKFEETNALIICCFSISLIVMGESERRNVA